MIAQWVRLAVGTILIPTCVVTSAVAAEIQGGSTAVVIVNGFPLYEADLGQEIGKILPENRSFHGKLSEEKISKIRSEAMQNLITVELQYQDAKSTGMKVSNADLSSEIDSLEKKFKSSKDFKATIGASGFNKQSFERFIERKLLSGRIRQIKVEDKLDITDAKVSEYYTKNIDRYSKPEEFRASHILLKVDPSSSAEQRADVRKRAEAILKRIKEGGNFADIAAQESEDLSQIKGGDLGYFHKGQMMVEFDEALAKMSVGQVSDIVETLYGYHVIKLIERKAPRQIPLEEMKGKIRSDLMEKEKKRLLDQWMSSLKAKAVITYPGAK